MKRECAVCGKYITRGYLCNDCWYQYGPKDKYPIWVKELIRIENRNYMQWHRHPEIYLEETQN